MKNINSVLAFNSPNLTNTDVKFDCQQVVKFNHKWLQIVEPTDMDISEEVLADEIDAQIDSDPLLKLLCLLFEENSEIPSELCQLYKEGLTILLRKWDDTRRVNGDQLYKNLSLQRKQDLLSQIALITFEEGEFFFKQDLEQYIIDYFFNLPNAPTNPELLKLASEATLKSIESQHTLLVEKAKGIYSFSDLRFHQYFVARAITQASNPQESDQGLKKLVSRLSETRWREVFVLVVGMLQNSDYLLRLMRQQADTILAADKELQHFLLWLNKKSNSGKGNYKPSTFRAVYLEFILDIDSEDAFEDECIDYDRVKAIDVDTMGELLDFPFTKQQKAILKQYYEANKLLIDCLQQARYVSRSLREEIEETLLVPSNFSKKSAIA